MSKKFSSLQWELAHSGAGKVPSEELLEGQAYVARVVHGDARKAEALADAYPSMDSLQRSRSFLSRGRVADAKSLLFELRATEQDAELQAEVALEESRCACFEGRWQDSLEMTLKAMSFGPTGISQMTLRQVRAVALMELGFFNEALGEAELAQSLAKLFPKTSLALYVTATQIKIWTLQGDLSKARQRLTLLWEQFHLASSPSVDTAILLLRLEIELRRQQGRSIIELAYSTWMLTKAAGDSHYEALAMLDIYAASGSEERSAWQGSLEWILTKFPKVQAFYDALQHTSDEEAQECASLQSLRKTRVETSHEFRPQNFESLTHVLILSARPFVVDLSSLKLSFIAGGPQLISALRALKNQTVSKEEFFKSVWGAQKFVPHLHDPGIRRLIFRLRKMNLVNVRVEETKISIPHAFIADVDLKKESK